MCLQWWNDGGIKSVSIRVICGICVLSFFDGSVILCLMVAWGLQRCSVYANGISEMDFCVYIYTFKIESKLII